MSLKSFCLAVCCVIAFAAAAASAVEPISLGEGRQPQVGLSSKGVYVTYAKGDAVYCARSMDGGKTFDEPVEVAAPTKLSVGMRRGPRIAVTEEAIVITAVAGEQGGGKDGDVVGWRSIDSGETWTPLDAAINRVPAAAREGLHAMAAGPKGQMFCAWLDLRNVNAGHGEQPAHKKQGNHGKKKGHGKHESHEPPAGHGGGGTEIWGALSTDGGKTWSRDFVIYRSPEKSVCQCCHPSVAYGADGKTIAVMFRNELAGNRDMYVVQSTNGGKNFGKAQKLGEGSWKLNACPMDGGMLDFPRQKGGAKSGKPATVWRRENDVIAASRGGPERTLGRGLQPWTTQSSDGAYSIWVSARPGDLMLSKAEDQPEKLAEGASDPTIASSPNGTIVVAAWEQGSEVKVAVVREREESARN